MAADIDNQPDFLGQRNEIIGRYYRAILFYPACQSFETNDFLGGDFHDRLIVDDDFVMFEGAPQLRLDVDAIFVGERQIGLIELESVLAQILGLIHRAVCLTLQCLAIFAIVRANRDAD